LKYIDWQSDVQQLKSELPKLHKNLFYAKNSAEFYGKINNLLQNLNSLDTYSIVMEIARIVASSKDAHTAAMLPRNYRFPFDCYPFEEGLFITATNDENKDLLYKKIMKIDNYDINIVCEKLTQVISHENMQFVLSSIPSFIVCADILYGIEVIEDIEKVVITIENEDGNKFEKTVIPVKYSDYKIQINPSSVLPLYRQNSGKFYWSNFDKGIFYINYNKCKDMDELSVKEFCSQLILEITSNTQIEKLVIDLRNNTGGNSELFEPFLLWISQNESINQKGRLYVIVGRDTFSSALLNTYFTKSRTNAVFIGESTGGKPNCFGEVKYLQLSSSGLYIRYSTNYFDIIEDDNQLSYIPDIGLKVTFQDYLSNRDSCMDYIEALPYI